MDNVKILGVVGSPRKKGNTLRLMEKAFEGAMSVPGVETEAYELAGKKIHHCIGCFKCMEKGACVFKDDLYEFTEKYMEADGILWGIPVYHMGLPGHMKNLIDRLGNMLLVHFISKGRDLPRLSKVCGVLAGGGSRFGGQELTLSFMLNSSVLMNCVAVAGDTMKESYIGAAAFTGDPDFLGKDNVLNDSTGLMMAESVGKRVAEMTRIVRAGMGVLQDELPAEYFDSYEPPSENIK